ncbi:MAG: 30S ribosomal protein S15 [Saprospiraceae bacterium]
MAIYLTNEKVEEIFKEYGGSASNTGSTEGQIALFTYRIKELSDHLQRNKKDHSCRRTLLTLVGKRKRLLFYLAKKDIMKYRALIEKLEIRNVRK